ncbi:hypothetical protein GW17_00025468 [Ensete ventricosum]|nr:hypothetical protein GW17_00025468 [Ensete ventricosum]
MLLTVFVSVLAIIACGERYSARWENDSVCGGLDPVFIGLWPQGQSPEMWWGYSASMDRLVLYAMDYCHCSSIPSLLPKTAPDGIHAWPTSSPGVGLPHVSDSGLTQRFDVPTNPVVRVNLATPHLEIRDARRRMGPVTNLSRTPLISFPLSSSASVSLVINAQKPHLPPFFSSSLPLRFGV